MIHNPKIFNTCTNAWCRPTDWNTVPYIAPTEQVIYLQFAVFNDDSNYFACLCSGAYTVDTGDGVVTNVASNTKFEYKINYANVTKVCNRGYKVAQIKITPQDGQNLTAIDLQQLHSATTNKYSNILEVIMNIPNVTSLMNSIGYTTIFHYMLENIEVKNSSTYTFQGIGYNVLNLKRVLLNTTDFNPSWSTSFLSSGLNVIDDSVIVGTSIDGSLSNAFNTANIRQFIPTISMARVTVTSSMFGSSGNLSRCICNGLILSFTIANHKMSASALNELFTSLGTTTTVKTVTVTGNPGAGTCDTSIATAKNWTVVII